MKLSCMCPISEHFVSLLKKARYDGIEAFAKDQFNPEKNSFAQMKHLKSLVERSGLEVVALCGLYPPDIKLLSPDPAMRKRGEIYLQNLIRISGDLGIGILAFGALPNRVCPSNVAYLDGYKRLVNLLQVGGELACPYNISIAVEEGSHEETNMITNMKELVHLIEAVNLPNVGIIADLDHMYKEDPDVLQALEEANGLIRHVHLSDVDRLPPGKGTLNFPDIISKLRALHYDGWLTLETKPRFWHQGALAGAKEVIGKIL